MSQEGHGFGVARQRSTLQFQGHKDTILAVDLTLCFRSFDSDMEKKLAERRVHEEKAHKVIAKLSTETIDEATLNKLVNFASDVPVPVVSIAIFFSGLKARLIEPFHYEEIVEERFLSKLCGYCLCSTELKTVSFTAEGFFDLSNSSAIKSWRF